MFQEFLIIKHSGECIYFLDLKESDFSKKNEKKVDPQLFSGFLSAIMAFYSQLHSGEGDINESEESLDFFHMKNSIYYILDTMGYFFCITDNGINTKLELNDIGDLLRGIKDKFFARVNNDEIDPDSSTIIINQDLEDDIRDLISGIIKRALFKRLSENATKNL